MADLSWLSPLFDGFSNNAIRKQRKIVILQHFTLQIHLPTPLTGYRKDVILGKIIRQLFFFIDRTEAWFQLLWFHCWMKRCKNPIFSSFLQNNAWPTVWPSCGIVLSVNQLCWPTSYLSTETTNLNLTFKLSVVLLKAAARLTLMNCFDPTLDLKQVRNDTVVSCA